MSVLCTKFQVRDRDVEKSLSPSFDTTPALIFGKPAFLGDVTNTPHRKIARSIHEDARDVARSIAQTPAYQQSRRDRTKVEMLFAHLKRILKLDRRTVWPLRRT